MLMESQIQQFSLTYIRETALTLCGITCENETIFNTTNTTHFICIFEIDGLPSLGHCAGYAHPHGHLYGITLLMDGLFQRGLDGS